MKPQRKNRKAKAKKPKPKRKVSPLPFKFKATDGKFYKLTSKQKYWCDVFLEEGANQTVASLEAYKVTNKHLCKIPWKMLTDKEIRRRMAAEKTASEIGRRCLGKVGIKAYIDKVLSDEGYTDDVVRTEHFKNIKQDENLTAKNQAIDMYYKKKDEYAPEKHEHTVRTVEVVRYGKPKKGKN